MAECLPTSLEIQPALSLLQPSLAEVLRVGRVELRCFSPYFNMPADRHATHMEEVQRPPGPVPLPEGRRKGPPLERLDAEVFLTHPALSLGGMPSLRPLPQSFEDAFVHIPEGPAGDQMPLTVRPAPQFPVELADKVERSGRLLGSDQIPDFPEHAKDAVLGWPDQELTPVLPDVRSEKV